MAKLDFSSKDLALVVARVQSHFQEEFDLELGRLEVEALLEFFAREIGGHFYNRGLYDAHAVILSKIDDIDDAVYQLEMHDDGSD